MKKVYVGIVLALATLLIAACTNDVAEQRDRDVVREQQQIYSEGQPVPIFDYSQDRDALIQIYEQKNQARLTYSVITSDGTGEVQFSCPSIGFAIPADTQLTNPLKLAYDHYDSPVIEQAEPNGLYSSNNTDGTYVLCVRKNGDVVPVYTEMKVTTFPFEVTVQDKRVLEVAGSESTLKVELKDTTTSTPVELSPTPSVHDAPTDTPERQ